ncbi:MAG: ATP-dependent DNA ligase [Candidatus Roizmanbacteria bacterium]|nr:ATP-dependent DNA ligase [Candidatus Roizmanbacteria bacterium]
MLFSELAHYLQEIESASSRLVMTRLLADLFKKTSAQEIGKVAYLVQGQTAPLYEHREFGVAEKLVLKALTSAFSLDSAQAKARNTSMGDLGLVAEASREETRELFDSTQSVTIEELFEKLYTLTTLSGTGSQDEKLALIADMLRISDPLSCRYIVRILIDKLRLGFSAMTILDAYSWMLTGDKTLRKSIERAYNVYPNLGHIGALLKKGGIHALSQIEPAVGVPILMARAERVEKPSDIIEKIGECAVEPKYDGFRLQLHYDKKKGTRLFTRGLDEVSYMYPEIVQAGNNELQCDSLILEGEAVGYNPDTGEFLPFQETVQRKRKYGIQEKALLVPLRLFVFDLLYLNGKNYLHKPYTIRKKMLKSIIKSKKVNTIVYTKEIRTRDPHALESLFDQYTSEGLEGVIAKKLDGTYEAGARGFNWIKFKRSYSKKLNDTIDCVVMGFDYGKGKRTSFGIGAFLAGVYNKASDTFETVAKIGTGLTDDEWRAMSAACEKNKAAQKPVQYIVDDMTTPDEWSYPSIVVEIRADEITKSPVHTAGKTSGIGYALRFPRLERFRADKKPTDITTTVELQDLYTVQKK